MGSGTMIRLDKLLSNLGYCSRKEARAFLKLHAVLEDGIPLVRPETKVNAEKITINGEPLDPLTGVAFLVHKPCGYVCSHKQEGSLIYELLPERYSYRNPQISTAGRLDKETSGLIILTDDGDLIHKLTSPRKRVPKVYELTVRDPLDGSEGAVFTSGTLMLEGEETPLLPADLMPLGPTTARLTIFEGRYHQVRRMFAALGNEVISLKRIRFGALDLGDLSEGEYRLLTKEDIEQALTPLP